MSKHLTVCETLESSTIPDKDTSNLFIGLNSGSSCCNDYDVNILLYILQSQGVRTSIGVYKL